MKDLTVLETSIVVAGILGLIFVLRTLLKAIFARQIAIYRRKRSLKLLWGLFELILWEADEGVVFLKYKKPWKIYPQSDSEFKDRGGTKWISALRGEELKALFTLKDNVYSWEASDVRTAEELLLFLKIDIFWEVVNVEKFIYKIGQNIRIEDESYHADLISASEKRINILVENHIRGIVAKSSVSQINPSDISNFISQAEYMEVKEIGKIFIRLQTEEQEKIENKLMEVVNQEIRRYGIKITKVKIEKTNLPDDVQKNLNDIFPKLIELSSVSVGNRIKENSIALKKKELEAENSAKIAAYINELGKEQALQLLVIEAMKDANFSTESDFLNGVIKISERLNSKRADENTHNK